MIDFVSLRRYLSSLPLLLIALSLIAPSLISCDNEPQAQPIDEPAAVDTGVTIVQLPLEGTRDTAFNPENVESFHEVVYRQYARLAVSLPRREMDSIMQSVPPMEIDKEMTRRLHRQDTIARRQLAEKYGITRDSIDAILASKNVPKR